MTIEIQIKDFDKYNRLVAFLQQLELPFVSKKEKESDSVAQKNFKTERNQSIPILKEIDPTVRAAVISKIEKGEFEIPNFTNFMADFEESRQDRVLF